MRTGPCLALAAALVFVSGTAAFADQRAAVYTCHFARYGQVVIDTRPESPAITVGGKTYAAQAGAYFFQTEDGKVAFFKPGMKAWSYAEARVDPDLKAAEASRCRRGTGKR